jgi:hypothetical protein
MKTTNKKLGLAGTLIAAGAGLMGCTSTAPQLTQINPTVQAVREYDNVKDNVDIGYRLAADKAAAEAKNQNTKRLNAQREQDLQPIKDAVNARDKFLRNKSEFDILCESPIFVATGTAVPSSIPSRQSLLVPQKDSANNFYVSADQRIDREDVPMAYGVGIRHQKRSKYIDFNADSMSNTVTNPSSNLTANKTGYNLAGGICTELGACTARMGLGYTFQATDIYGQNGISTIDETRTDHFPYVEAGLQIGRKKFVDVKVRQGLGGDNRNSSGVTLSIGIRK